MDNKPIIREGYTLPSKGEIYDVPVNPHVELRSMTVREEARRLAPSKTPYKLLADIIEDCMIEKPAIHVYDMCIGDYEYLLHKLRVVTHGPEYKMGVYCPNCGEVSDTTINLDDLKTFDFNINEFKDKLTMILPKCGRTVKIKFQTPKLLDEIKVRTSDMKSRSKDSKMDYELPITLQCIIDTVDGQKLTYTEKEDFINKLPASDMNDILNRVTEVNRMIGLDTRINIACEKCGGDISTFFRFGSEFFRPTKR